MGIHEYAYADAQPTWANGYLWPALQRQVAKRDWPDKRAFDLGCGNGATCNMLRSLGFDVTGIDTSVSGISIAQRAFADCHFHVASAYDPLVQRFGTFPLVVSLEVIEHCLEPRAFGRTFYDLIAPGGLGLLSTPYHGYWKNLALAATGKMDAHFTALWDGGHVKFFSVATLGQLLREVGATEVDFLRIGRIRQFAKSMIAVISKPI